MNVEIVVTRQPEWPLTRLLGDRGLQRLDRAIQQPAPWLGNEQMNMLGHHDIAEYAKDIPPAHGFESALKEFADWSGVKIGKPVVATEGEEMKVFTLLEPFEPGRHGGGILLPP
jgi:hypothetical protein